jgi:hypothetical protein
MVSIYQKRAQTTIQKKRLFLFSRKLVVMDLLAKDEAGIKGHATPNG